MLDLDNQYNFRQVPDNNCEGKFYFVSNITPYVKDVFGDVVKYAQQVIYHGSETDEEIENTLRYILNDIEMFHDLVLPRGRILIKFYNDKVVEFRGSLFGILEETERCFPGFDRTELVSGDTVKINKVYRGDMKHYFLDITSKLKDVFGDVLTKAEQLVLAEYTSSNIDKLAIRSSAKIMQADSITLEDGDITLTLVGGKMVQFEQEHRYGTITQGFLMGGVGL